MSDDRNLRRVAEDRLSELRQEGIVTGLSVVQRGSKPELYVGVAAQTGAQVPAGQHANIDRARIRIKHALRDIPFHILGELERPSKLPDAPPPVFQPLPVNAHTSAKANHRDSVSPERELALDLSEARIRSLAADVRNLRKRVDEVERKLARAPSKSFILFITGASFALFSLLVSFPQDAQIIVTYVAKWVSDSVGNWIR